MCRILSVWRAYKLGAISETELNNCLDFLTNTTIFDKREEN